MTIMMGCDGIDAIFIDSLPSGKVTRIERAVRVSNITLLQTKSGRIYSDCSRRVCLGIGIYGITKPVLKALVKFKAITQEQAEQHIQVCEKRQKASQSNYDLKELERKAGEYGFKLNKSQIDAVKKGKNK